LVAKFLAEKFSGRQNAARFFLRRLCKFLLACGGRDFADRLAFLSNPRNQVKTAEIAHFAMRALRPHYKSSDLITPTFGSPGFDVSYFRNLRVRQFTGMFFWSGKASNPGPVTNNRGPEGIDFAAPYSDPSSMFS